MDVREQFLAMGKPHELFYMSHKMIRSLAVNLQKIWKNLSGSAPGRQFSVCRFSGPWIFWSSICSVITGDVYEKEQQESADFFGTGSGEEKWRKQPEEFCGWYRESQDYRYGQIAVITGNLEEYGSVARQVFEDAGIPFFIDEKHSVLMNPFVEYVRAALEMVSSGIQL